MNIKNIKYLLIPFLVLWLYFPASCQYKILEDKEAVTKVHQAIDSIYNLNFDAADIIIEELEKDLKDYVGILLLKAFYVSWENNPIKKEHESYKLFESYLLQGIEKSEAILEKDPESVEANFYLMAFHAYLAELYVENGQNFKALGEAKSAYKFIKIGFDHTEDNPEFYFSSGIYNYYRERYPEENPFYKSFLWFFRSGDMAEGIAQLKKGSQLAVFTKAECLTYLFHVYLRYEDNPEEAIFYSIILKDKYPNNLHFVSNFIENKIRLNQYDKLYQHIERLLDSDKVFYRYLGEIFYGTYLENFEQKASEALKHYKIADNLGDQDEVRVPHQDSMLFLGMGRVYKSIGNTDEGTNYLKKSVKTAEYSAYRKDAEALLNE